ncbi:MAG: hypothetical protein Q6373_005895 [Candidatus Sigynarchaeota archaeon]
MKQKILAKFINKIHVIDDVAKDPDISSECSVIIGIAGLLVA